jgi:cell division protein FtsB
MLLKFLHRVGLTDLSQEEVEQFEAAVRSGAKIRANRQVRFWGALSIGLFLLLIGFSFAAIPMAKSIYQFWKLETRIADLDQATQGEVDHTRGTGETVLLPPSPALQKLRDRVVALHRQLSALRSGTIDYSSLGSQREKLASLDRQLAELSREIKLTKQRESMPRREG